MDEGVEHQESPKAGCLGRGEQCPLCGEDNTCRVAKGHLYKGACWCHGIVVPGHILRRLAEEYSEQACLCPSCLEAVARLAAEHADVETVISEVKRIRQTPPAAEPDFYSENGNVVFTAAYHLKRGICCKNGCRHCPY